MKRTAALLSAVLVMPFAFAQTTATAPVTVSGQLGTPLSFTRADLQAMPSREVKVTYLSGSGSSTHTYTGVLLFDLLSRAKPQFDSATKNDKLSWVVRATGADKYTAVFAWGELDPDFGNKGVLVAYAQDGQPLPAKNGALQLVVPGDLKGGRYVNNLVSLQVFRPGN